MYTAAVYLIQADRQLMNEKTFPNFRNKFKLTNHEC
jgi:hypothetical protein